MPALLGKDVQERPGAGGGAPVRRQRRRLLTQEVGDDSLIKRIQHRRNSLYDAVCEPARLSWFGDLARQSGGDILML